MEPHFERNPIECGAKRSRSTIESYYSWLVVCLALVATSLSFGAVTSIPILMKPISEELQWDRATISLSHSVAMLVAGGGGLVIGYFADRIRFSYISILSAFAIGTGLWITSEANTPLQMNLAFGILVGIGQGTYFGPITAFVSHWFDQNRGLAMSIALSGQSVGGLAFTILLRTGAEKFGWRDAIQVYGLITMTIIFVCSLAFHRRPVNYQSESDFRPKMDLAPNPKIQKFVGIVAFLVPVNLGSFVVIAHLVAFCEEQGLEPALASSALAYVLGVTLISRLFSGYLIDKGYARLTLVVCGIAISVGAAVLGTSHGQIFMLIAGGVCFGLGYGALFPVCTSIVRGAFASSSAGTWVSMMFLFAFSAAAAGSWFGGEIYDQTGSYTAAFEFASMFAIFGVMTFLFLRSKL